MQLLVAGSVHVNLTDGIYGCALQAASSKNAKGALSTEISIEEAENLD